MHILNKSISNVNFFAKKVMMFWYFVWKLWKSKQQYCSTMIVVDFNKSPFMPEWMTTGISHAWRRNPSNYNRNCNWQRFTRTSERAIVNPWFVKSPCVKYFTLDFIGPHERNNNFVNFGHLGSFGTFEKIDTKIF